MQKRSHKEKVNVSTYLTYSVFHSTLKAFKQKMKSPRDLVIMYVNICFAY